MLTDFDSWDSTDRTLDWDEPTPGAIDCRELTLSSEADERGLTVRLRGILSGAGARAVCARLRDLLRRQGDRISLDASGLLDVSDFGAAVLSLGLRCEPELQAKVVLVSISPPARRKLGRFGVDMPGAPPG